MINIMANSVDPDKMAQQDQHCLLKKKKNKKTKKKKQKKNRKHCLVCRAERVNLFIVVDDICQYSAGDHKVSLDNIFHVCNNVNLNTKLRQPSCDFIK